MPAVFVNMGTVLAGSLIGVILRNKIKEKYVNMLMSALGLVTIVIGIISAVETDSILCMVICMAVGTFIGTLLNLDGRIEGCGDWIKNKVLKGRFSGGRFTEGFVTACIVFCVGSMTIMGSFEAGINHDYSIIFAKSAMDFVSSMMFGAAMGLGVTFSVLFILVFQGGLTLLAGLLSSVLSTAVVTEMSAVGGAILIGLGINLIGISDKKIKVANMLLSIFLPIGYIPLSSWISSLIG